MPTATAESDPRPTPRHGDVGQSLTVDATDDQGGPLHPIEL